jgi:hypothetical protein
VKREDSYFDSGIVLIGKKEDNPNNFQLVRLLGSSNNCWDIHGKMVVIQTIPTSEELKAKNQRDWYGPENTGIISRGKIIRKVSAQEIFDFLFSKATANAK